MYKLTNFILLLAMTCVVSACAIELAGDGEPAKEETVRAFDGVKLISKGIDKGQDPRTFNQTSYSISNESRLLLRYGDMSSMVQRVSSDERSVILRVAIADGDAASAKLDFKVCPLETNWMMAATWRSAHPYFKGRWRHEGGDLATEGCVSPLSFAKETPEPEDKEDEASPPEETEEEFFAACKEDPRMLCFDVSDWFHSYVVEREINYGLILISEGSTVHTVFGDKSSLGPRLHWITEQYSVEVGSSTRD